MPRKSNPVTKGKLVPMILLVLVALAIGGYYVWDSVLDGSAPLPPALTANPGQSKSTTPAASAVKPPVSNRQANPEGPRKEHLLFSSGKLKSVTDLVSDVEILKLEALKEELEIKAGKRVETQPTPVPLSERDLVNLVSPPGSLNQTEQMPKPVQPARRVRVLSIQGMDQDVKALVEFNGLRTVKVGDNLWDGKIQKISSVGILLRRAGKTELLPVE